MSNDENNNNTNDNNEKDFDLEELERILKSNENKKLRLTLREKASDDDRKTLLYLYLHIIGLMCINKNWGVNITRQMKLELKETQNSSSDDEGTGESGGEETGGTGDVGENNDTENNEEEITEPVPLPSLKDLESISFLEIYRQYQKKDSDKCDIERFLVAESNLDLEKTDVNWNNLIIELENLKFEEGEIISFVNTKRYRKSELIKKGLGDSSKILLSAEAQSLSSPAWQGDEKLTPVLEFYAEEDFIFPPEAFDNPDKEDFHKTIDSFAKSIDVNPEYFVCGDSSLFEYKIEKEKIEDGDIEKFEKEKESVINTLESRTLLKLVPKDKKKPKFILDKSILDSIIDL